MTPTMISTDTPTSVNTFTTKANSGTVVNVTVASKPSMYTGIEKSEIFR